MLFGNPRAIDPTLVSLKVRTVKIVPTGNTFVRTYDYYNLTLCTEDKFPINDDFLQNLFYADGVYCPDNYDFPMKGNIAAEELLGLNIELTKCQGAGCQSNASMNLILAQSR